MASTQSRKWQLTINNPLDKGYTHDKIKEALATFKSIRYCCMADEIGLETQTPHTHIFLAAASGVRFSSLKKCFADAHIEQARGTSEENRDYIAKSGKWENDPKGDTSVKGTFEEWGEIPQECQGERVDLAILYGMIKDGLSNYEILEQNPDYILTLDKLERVRQAVREDEFRSTFRILEVTYIWGVTNTGKTRSVMEEYGYENVFRVTGSLHGAFDTYRGQDVIVFEEFRSSFKIQDMLNYLDGYPVELPCRYVNKVACFTKVFLISNIDLTEQYRNIFYENKATWDAFMRRINKVVKFFADGHTAEYTTNDYLHGFVEIENGDLPFGDPSPDKPPLPTEAPPEYKQMKLTRKKPAYRSS